MSFFRFLFSKTFLIQLVLAVFAVVLIAFIILQWLDFSTNQDQRITVPNLERLSLDRVDEQLAELDLRREILDSANYNPDFPKYSVIDQIPKPGKFVKEDRKLYLTLNPSGYRKIEVPDVVGRTRRQAEPTLLAMGFKIGKISYRPHISDNVLELRYKGEKLEPGTPLQKTSVIDLIVGDESLNRIQTEGDSSEDNPEAPTENEEDNNGEF